MPSEHWVDHETDVQVVPAWHPSGDQYTIAIATCDECGWTGRGDECDVRDAAAQHEREARQQGFTDVVVERAAHAILTAEHPEASGWSGKPESVREHYRKLARAALDVVDSSGGPWC